MSKNLFFDTLAEVKEASKTSNSHSSAYMDTVEGELRSKAKCLAKQAFLPLIRQKTKIFATFPKRGRLFRNTPVRILRFADLGVL